VSARARIQLHAHEVPEEVFEPFARVFGVKEHLGARWVAFTAEGVFVTMFAAGTAEPVAEEVS
jgi:hypothetical protein